MGLNVTIPFKEEVLPLLDEIDVTARKVGAVNTIKIIREPELRLIGYNTDVIGFKKSIRPFLAIQHQNALILGNGGASLAVKHVLKEFQIPYFTCSRSPNLNSAFIQYEDLDSAAINHFKLIINCTPIGMSPNIDEAPPIPIDSISSEHLVFDLIYNPEQTKLLQIAKNKGAEISNGLNMLKMQADASWEIWKENNF